MKSKIKVTYATSGKTINIKSKMFLNIDQLLYCAVNDSNIQMQYYINNTV